MDLNCVATKDNLGKREVQLSCNLCTLCGASEELVQHYFFECMISNFAWNLCFKWFGVLTRQYNQTLQHFDQFYMSGLNIKENKLWKVMRVAMIRRIWNHRNSIVFRNGQRDGEKIFGLTQLKTWTWLRNKIPKINFSYSNWCLCSKSCIQSVVH